MKLVKEAECTKIKKKLKKGKSTEQIADELEEDINIIQKVVEKLKSQI